jgi:hypothetical protein
MGQGVFHLKWGTMKHAHKVSRRVAGTAAVVLVVGLSGGAAALASDSPQVIAHGLNSPRQLSFTPGGTLYVAEAGSGGAGPCQVSPDTGKNCFGLSGALARVGGNGTVTRVVTGLPSLASAEGSAGPSDLVFTGNHKFALTIGLGGTPDFRSGFGRDAALLGTVVTGDLRAHKGAGTVHEVFDVAGFEAAANPDGTDVDSNATGIARSGNGWVVTDSGGNDVISTRKGGSTVGVLPPVPTTKPVSTPQGPLPVGFPADAVPTDVVRGPDGAWYVSQLVGFPFEPGSSSIWRIVPGHAPQKWATGLTNVTSLAFADDGSLYAVEIAERGLLNGPVGALVKVAPHSTAPQVIEGGLFAPYGLAIRGHSAYVTTGSVTPAGEVVKIRL